MELRLAVKREYFDAIKNGSKTEEYRLRNDYWRKRLGRGKRFTKVVITLGYPKADETDKILTFPWVGWRVKKITHPHFGADEVEVFAIIIGETK